MPTYKTLYKGEFLNVETDTDNAANQKLVEVFIYDTDSGLGSVETTIDLELTDEPIILETINTAESKYETRRPRKVEVKIYSSDSVTIETFGGGGDQRFYMELKYDSVLKFVGWLSISDLRQDFMPHPNEISLVATCGLNLLDNIPLTDFDSVNPTYEHRIIEFLAWALSKTGHQLNIVCSFNIREEGAANLNDDADGDSHFFKWLWLFAKSFEDDINVSVSAGQVLDIILKRMAYVVQKDGYWFISNIDEIETRDLYLFTFDYLGNFVSKTTDDFTRSIGIDQLSTWMNDDQSKSLENAVKEVQLDFELAVPKEILTNYDLSRGTDLTSTTIDPEGWKLERNYPALAETVTVGYIKRVIVDDEEVERYLHIEPSASNFYHAWRNLDKIPVNAGGKLRISIDWRHDANEGGSGTYHLPVAMVRLWGDDGSHWHMNLAGGYGSSDPRPYWILSNSTWATNARYLYHDGNFGQDDLSEWQTASGTSAAIPVTGRLEVFLVHNFKSDERGKSFAAITFEYIPYVAGTYEKYRLQRHKVSQVLSTVQVINDSVGISDSSVYLFKGTLLKVSGVNTLFTGTVTISGTNSISFPAASGYLNYLFAVGKKITTTGTNTGYYTVESITYHAVGDNTEIIIKEDNLSSETASMSVNELLFTMANSFYAANVFPDGVPDETYYHRYGYLQVLDVWNQNNRVMAKFEGSVDHLGSDDDILDLTQKYRLTDPDLSTNGKVFMALHMRNDLHNVQSSIFLHEVFDENIPKNYPDVTFKYVT